MKSLLIAETYFPPQVGGISHMMARIAGELGPERVCCLTGVQRGQEGAPEAERAPLRVYRRPRAFKGNRWTQSLHLGTALSQIWLRERPRAAQLATAYEGSVGLQLKRLLGIPYLVYAHGNEVLDAMRSSWPRPLEALRAADRVVANSRFTAGLVEEAGVRPERVAIVHPGCDTEHYRPLERSEALRAELFGADFRGPVIISVGNLVARKGHDMVLRALPEMRAQAPGLRYLIVGDGPHRQVLEQEASEAGVRAHVVFAGRPASSELPQYYAQGDVFVMPSRQVLDRGDVEGFGIVYIEASACGKPVVGGRSGGVSDAVEEGQTGLLVDPEEPASIAAAVGQILSNRVLAARLGAFGRERTARHFTWARVAQDVNRILEGIVEEGEGRRPDPLPRM